MPLPVSQETVRKRLMGIRDPRGMTGIFSRGSNIYNSTSNAANFQGAALQRLGVNQPFSSQPVTPPTAPAAPTKLEDYPFDRLYEMGLRDISGAESEIASNEELARRRLLEDYGAAERNLNLGYNQNLDRLGQRMANQGLTYSGINVSERGELGQELGRETEMLTQGRSRGLEDIAREVSAQRGEITREKERLDYERAERLKETELAQAQREAEAKANEALLKSLQPTPTGKIPLPGSNVNRSQQMSAYRERLKKRYPHWTTAQLTAAVRKQFPLPVGGGTGGPEYSGLAAKRLGV